MLEILLLLLIPVAAWIGWMLARNTVSRSERKRNRNFSHRYFQGLNYLLDEQPDKAIAVFIEMAEVTADTIETHLALGSLFRRRGEVERAIRIHQNIISKPGLDATQKTRALLELGEDYMRVGLFDRAENLFKELIELDSHTPSALRHLLDIYQQEKDWQQALQQAQKLEAATDEKMGLVMAHFCCEMAEVDLQAGKPVAARKHLRQARRYYPESIRARLILARIAEQQDMPAEAIAVYEEIAEMNKEYIHDILQQYLECAQKADEYPRALEQMKNWSQNYDGVSLLLSQTAVIRKEEGLEAATRYLAEALTRRPSVKGLDHLIELKLEGGPETESGDEILRAVAEKLLARQPSYRCTHCGYAGHSHHWQCPSCKNWSTTRIIRGVLGE
ncbi:MAG: lipopolysaccharide assembly protein LapB [Gammaproteobacteria bacterium]|nr:MAG: lipopolysaccharide assembly protein LapB [Gammaproteobacteria bacterium]